MLQNQRRDLQLLSLVLELLGWLYVMKKIVWHDILVCLLFLRFGSFLLYSLFKLYFFRLLKVQELPGHQGLLGLVWTPRGMTKVGALSSFLLIEFWFSMILKCWPHTALALWFSLLLLAKKFGVTEFVNPKDHDRPVQEVENSLVILKFTFYIASCYLNLHGISQSYLYS